MAVRAAAPGDDHETCPPLLCRGDEDPRVQAHELPHADARLLILPPPRCESLHRRVRVPVRVGARIRVRGGRVRVGVRVCRRHLGLHGHA